METLKMQIFSAFREYFQDVFGIPLMWWKKDNKQNKNKQKNTQPVWVDSEYSVGTLG